MVDYHSSVGTLEENKASEPENRSEFITNSKFDSGGELCKSDITQVSLPDEDETWADEQEETGPKFRRPYVPRGFYFLPSWYGVYYDLKEDDSEQAFCYLERLIDFGVLGVEPPRDSPEDRLIYSLLDGPMHVIDKDYRKYLDVIADDKRKKDEAKAKELFEKNERQARKKRYG